VLAPSGTTAIWTEQFRRMVSEGQASGCVVAGHASGAIAEVGGKAAALGLGFRKVLQGARSVSSSGFPRSSVSTLLRELREEIEALS
jgi:hypothetical protein